jgi:hypothetical protein
MHSGFWLMALAMLAIAPPMRAAVDDEAWIENFMAQPGRSAGPAQIRAGYQVDWRELGRFSEVRVKVTTDLGHVHRGYIEHVDASSMWLRAELHGGYANLILRRDRVRSTELE